MSYEELKKLLFSKNVDKNLQDYYLNNCDRFDDLEKSLVSDALMSQSEEDTCRADKILLS